MDGTIHSHWLVNDSQVGEANAKMHAPKPLRYPKRKVLSVSIDIFGLSTCLGVIVFIILCFRSDGDVVGAYELNLVRVSGILTTLLPYMFSFILGRMLLQLANWRLENGIDIISLAYLTRCSTLASTLTTPFQIWSFHWIPILLGLMWMFSPLGSQAALRCIAIQQDVVRTTASHPLQYLYTTASVGLAGSDDAEGVNAANAVLLSSLLSDTSSTSQPEDAWGNIKVPVIENLIQSPEQGGWINLEPSSNRSYTALSGIPCTKPTEVQNYTFSIESWYWHLQVPILTTYSYLPPSNTCNIFSPCMLPVYSATEYLNFTDHSGLWQFLIPATYNSSTMAKVPLVFEQSYYSQSNSSIRNVTRIEGQLAPTSVELQVFCDLSTCQATNIRNSSVSGSDTAADEWDRTYLITWFFRYLTEALPSEHDGTPFPGLLENFLSNSTQDPFIDGPNDAGVYLYSLGTDALASRLSQIINTYWTATVALGNMAGTFNTSDPIFESSDSSPLVHNATATLYSFGEFFQVDHRWLTALSLSAIVLLGAVMASLLLSVLRTGPDAVDFISALTRSDEQTQLPFGSHLDSDDRVRFLKGMQLKIGDASPEESIGTVVISQAPLVSDLEKERLYR